MPPVVSRSDRIVRRTAMVGAATAAYLLLTADYGPNYPNPGERTECFSFGECVRTMQEIRKGMESLALFSKPDRSGVHQAQQADTNSKPDGK